MTNRLRRGQTFPAQTVLARVGNTPGPAIAVKIASLFQGSANSAGGGGGGGGTTLPSLASGDIWVGNASNVATAVAPSGDVTMTNAGVFTVKANLKVAAITFLIDGAGSAITTGLKGYLQIPFACTITEVTQLADQSGSIVVNIYKCTYAQFDAGSTHPVVGDKITASAPPTISTATKSDDSTLTGWTTSIAAGDILAFNVDSATIITRNTLTLWVTKT